MLIDNDTIAAIASPPGKGGIGVIRVSGQGVAAITRSVAGGLPEPRKARLAYFKTRDGEVIDQGLVFYFPGPHSFTGEDVVEFHGHGGPVVLDLLLSELCQQGARLARPGEFSERAFLNDKIDLLQAEAIADLIDASTAQAARGAVHSLQGVFSDQINELVKELIQLRVYVEAAIDFPEEEIDFLADPGISQGAKRIRQRLDAIVAGSTQGVLLRDGLQVVLAGKPNVGKSSLLNALTGQDLAIVSNIEGTTRDTVKASLNLDGVPLHLVDTAGLRSTVDKVEQLGISRTLQELERADLVIIVSDNDEPVDKLLTLLPDQVHGAVPLLLIRNKIDLRQQTVFVSRQQGYSEVGISAMTGEGVPELKAELKQLVGFNESGETLFIARRRHLGALETASRHVQEGLDQLQRYRAGELLAEELRLAGEALTAITGEFTADDLLGEIFSSFCIGK